MGKEKGKEKIKEKKKETKKKKIHFDVWFKDNKENLRQSSEGSNFNCFL